MGANVTKSLITLHWVDPLHFFNELISLFCWGEKNHSVITLPSNVTVGLTGSYFMQH